MHVYLTSNLYKMDKRYNQNFKAFGTTNDYQATVWELHIKHASIK